MIVILSSRPCATTLPCDLAAGQERRPDLDVGAFADQQHLVELDGVADGGVETFHAHALALAGAVLLTACAKNSIHDDGTPSDVEDRARSPRKGRQF